MPAHRFVAQSAEFFVATDMLAENFLGMTKRVWSEGLPLDSDGDGCYLRSGFEGLGAPASTRAPNWSLRLPPVVVKACA